MYTVCMRISSHESSLNTDCEKKIVTAKLRSTRKSNIRVEFNRRADSRARRVFSRLSKRTFLHAFFYTPHLCTGRILCKRCELTCGGCNCGTPAGMASCTCDYRFRKGTSASPQDILDIWNKKGRREHAREDARAPIVKQNSPPCNVLIARVRFPCCFPLHFHNFVFAASSAILKYRERTFPTSGTFLRIFRFFYIPPPPLPPPPFQELSVENEFRGWLFSQAFVLALLIRDQWLLLFYIEL